MRCPARERGEDSLLMGAIMKYEKPKLIELKTTTAVGGQDCIAGPTALDKCQNGGGAAAGDCDSGNRANICKAGGVGG